MIHVSSIAHALFTSISSDQTVVDSGFTVERGVALNTNPQLVPWVGVYFSGLEVDPHTVGGSQPWLGTMELAVYIQDAGHGTAGEAENNVGLATTTVLTAINSNQGLSGAALQLTGMVIEPFQRDITGDDFLFTDEIIFAFEVRG